MAYGRSLVKIEGVFYEPNALLKLQASQYSSANNCSQPIALKLLHPPYDFSFQLVVPDQPQIRAINPKPNPNVTLTLILTLLTLITPRCNTIRRSVAA